MLKGAKPWVSWMMPATEPTAETMVTAQQKALSPCSAHQYGENILMFFWTMCIWICRHVSQSISFSRVTSIGCSEHPNTLQEHAGPA